MDIYRQAAEIVQKVRLRQGTAKALCLETQVQKKKATFAVVCETLRHYDLLKDVLLTAQFFEYYPKVEPFLATVLCFDAVIGRGVLSRQDPAACAVAESIGYLKQAYEKVKSNHVIPPSIHERNLPRYARLNPLKGKTTEELAEKLRVVATDEESTVPRDSKRTRDGEEAGEGPTPGEAPPAVGKKPRRMHPNPVEDEHIPHVIRYPSGTDLHAHPLVTGGHLILQDKASCFPAAVLFNAVKTVRYDAQGKKRKDDFVPPQWVVDGCAAPGNKTTHLAALGQPTEVSVLAVERDESRAQLLQRRVTQLGGDRFVKVCHCSFLELDDVVHEKAEAILLDPSCSSSGVVSRVDVATAKPMEVGASATAKKRVASLAAMQKVLVRHALTAFPNCRRVVYSTCSVNVEEDEDVVREMLADPEIGNRWGLTAILPKTWDTRGVDIPLRPKAKADEPEPEPEQKQEIAPKKNPTPVAKAVGINNTTNKTTKLDDSDDDEGMPAAAPATTNTAKPPPMQEEEEEEGEVEMAPTSRCIRCDSEVDETSGFFVACFDRFLDAKPFEKLSS